MAKETSLPFSNRSQIRTSATVNGIRSKQSNHSMWSHWLLTTSIRSQPSVPPPVYRRTQQDRCSSVAIHICRRRAAWAFVDHSWDAFEMFASKINCNTFIRKWPLATFKLAFVRWTNSNAIQCVEMSNNKKKNKNKNWIFRKKERKRKENNLFENKTIILLCGTGHWNYYHYYYYY